MIHSHTPLADLHWPHLPMILAEAFSVPSWELFPHTVSELAELADMDEEEVIQRLNLLGSLLKDPEITPQQLKMLMNNSKDIVLLDVRTAQEYTMCHLNGSLLVAHADMMALLPKFKDAAHVVTICHHGVRSLSAALFLRAHGVTHAVSLQGGLDRWAEHIDPSMKRY